MAAIGGITTIAVSEAMLPTVPTNAITYGIIAAGTFFKELFSMEISIPDSSQRPIPSVMVITRPNGAKPVKFFTMLPKIQSTPSLENRFADVTTSPEAGFVRATPITLKMQPMMAVIRKSQQNRIAGGGNLLQTFSIPSISLSTPVFFTVVSLLI